MSTDDLTLIPVPKEEPYHVRLAGFQEDVGAWSAHNFDWREKADLAQNDPLVGLVEEVGELAAAQIDAITGTNEAVPPTPQQLILAGAAAFGKMAHAVLKTAQGIRKEEDHRATVRAEMERLYVAVEWLARLTGVDVQEVRDVAEFIGTEIFPSKLSGASEQRAVQADSVGDIAVYLADYCERNGLDLERSVNHTWGRPVDPVTGKGGVRHRDWKAHRNDGGGHAKVEAGGK